MEVPAGKKLGLLYRKTGFGQLCKPLRDAIEIVPTDDWPKYIGLVSLKRHVRSVFDQDGVGSCAAEATAGATKIVRDVEGKPFVELNPWSIYWSTSGGRDNGSSLDDNLAYIIEHGVCTEEDWPRGEHKWSNEPSELAKERGRQFKGLEWFDIGDKDEFGTALLAGFPVVFGTNMYGGGHAMCAVEVLDTKKFLTLNSWGESDGDGGFVEVKFSQVHFGYGAWALRSTVGAESMP
jgi:hypothetical protein